MQNTPKGLRLHIGIYGKRNVGKSSLLNCLTQQETSIVSETAGTTTDPVNKAMELLPIGPVLFIDTAGIDDMGSLGQQRIEKTKKALERTDIALIVCDSPQWGTFEQDLAKECQATNTPILAVFNKSDLYCKVQDFAINLPHVAVSTREPDICRNTIRDALVPLLPEEYLQTPAIVGDLVAPGSLILLVVPIDLEAPRGRLILPQVQTIRDILDHDAIALVTKERELKATFDMLKSHPAMVVTDSQAFLKVDADTPLGIPLTSFSILFARIKGDLETFVKGAQTIDQLQSGDRILIAEACTHHQIGDDIGRTKIPRWITQYTGAKLHFEHVQGNDFPDDITPYKLVIHCGSCTFNRRHLITRILRCEAAGVAIANYGITIAKSLGILQRALSPFPHINPTNP